MIRRGFWVVTGAVLGVTGYRRVTRLASMLSVPKSARSRPGPGSAAGQRMLPTAPGRVLVQATPRRVAPGVLAPGGGVRTNVARAVAAAGFLRDVRDGMAEYWDLHRGDRDRTLGSQGPQTTSAGASSSRAPSSRVAAGWAFSGGGERDPREQDRLEQDRLEQDRREP
jgi:hypothetical protein